MARDLVVARDPRKVSLKGVQKSLDQMWLRCGENNYCDYCYYYYTHIIYIPYIGRYRIETYRYGTLKDSTAPDRGPGALPLNHVREECLQEYRCWGSSRKRLYVKLVMRS